MKRFLAVLALSTLFVAARGQEQSAQMVQGDPPEDVAGRDQITTNDPALTREILFGRK